MIALAGAAATIFLYGAASQVGGVQPLKGKSVRSKFLETSALSHSESRTQYVLGSSTCLLGKLAFLAWSIVLIALLTFYHMSWKYKKHVRYTLWSLLLLTIVLSFAMNPPLAIRALPAFAGLGFLIPALTHRKEYI